MDLDHVLRSVCKHGASDLHLQVGSPPTARVHGELSPLQMDPLTPGDLEAAVDQIADDRAKKALDSDLNADFSHLIEGVSRFRVSVFRERGQFSIAFRAIPLTIPTIEELGLPSVLLEIAEERQGLVLVTGTTGSGKSTTLAAMIDLVNRTKRTRIITVEDPIEFVHTSEKSLIAQRELRRDATGFHAALREALRQDPDTILVGELRDVETMTTALQAADTGHKVYSTLHTTTASQSIKRLVAMIPPDERELLMTQLSLNLTAIISQRLARTREGDGRVPVLEILRSSSFVRKQIAEGRPDKLAEAMAERHSGMQLFDQHLTELYLEKLISGREALRLATNPEAVTMTMRGMERPT